MARLIIKPIVAKDAQTFISEHTDKVSSMSYLPEKEALILISNDADKLSAIKAEVASVLEISKYDIIEDDNTKAVDIIEEPSLIGSVVNKTVGTVTDFFSGIYSSIFK